MPNEALILRNDNQRTVSWTETALALKNAALEKSALIAKVKTAEDQKLAVDALRDLKQITQTAEKARVACKEPVLKFGRDIDAAAKAFLKEADEEIDRVTYLVNEFQRFEQMRIDAERRAADEERSKLERERQAQIAKAQSIEQIDDIKEEFSRKEAEVVLKLTPPAKAVGQTVVEDWEIEVFDLWLLARAHPGCVKIEPRVSEIKALLKAGVKEVAGVRAKPIKRNVIRASTDVPAINV